MWGHERAANVGGTERLQLVGQGPEPPARLCGFVDSPRGKRKMPPNESRGSTSTVPQRTTCNCRKCSAPRQRDKLTEHQKGTGCLLRTVPTERTHTDEKDALLVSFDVPYEGKLS